MLRRNFIQTLLGLALALGLKGKAQATQARGKKPLPRLGAKTGVALVGIPTSANKQEIEEAVRDVALEASDFSWLKKGDGVFLKPVVNSANPYPATTSPLAITAMVKLLKQRGAGKVFLGDMSGIGHVKLTPDGVSRGSSRKIMAACGISGPAQEAGASLHFFEEAGWKGFDPFFPPPGSHWKGPLWMPKILEEVDHIILLPRCGRHALAGSSLGLKAVVGYLRFDNRLELHRDAASFHEKIAEANWVAPLIQKQRLVLTLADRVLSTFGPDRGYVCRPDPGLVMASESIVAHDMMSLAWLSQNWLATPRAERDHWFEDPNQSPLIVDISNRVATGLIGGMGAGMKSESLKRADLQVIRQDPTLIRAFELMEEVPNIQINLLNNSLNSAILAQLTQLTRFEQD